MKENKIIIHKSNNYKQKMNKQYKIINNNTIKNMKI